jgi:hypothetical protein
MKGLLYIENTSYLAQTLEQLSLSDPKLKSKDEVSVKNVEGVWENKGIDPFILYLGPR